MKVLKKKVVIALAAVVFTLPVLSAGAGSGDSWNIEKAVREIEDNDLSLNISTAKPRVSNEARVYEAQWANLLNNLQTSQADYTDSQKEYQVELSAYELLYNYWFLQQSVKVNQEAVSKAARELEVTRLKNQQGVASVRNVLEAEIRLNTAKAAYQDAQAAANSLKFQLNQKLGENNINREILVAAPEFKLINAPNPEDLAEDMLDSHQSLSPLERTIDTYETILDRIDALSVVDAAYQPELDKAKTELKIYYRAAKDDAETNLQLQRQALELLSYNLAEQFKQQEAKIKLYEANLNSTQRLYTQAQKSFEVGVSDALALEQARISVSQTKMQLLGAQKDYLILKEKLSLFKKGYMPRG